MTTQPIHSLTDAWNNGATAFTGIGMNVTDTASAAGSMLLNLQVGGTSRFAVNKTGRLTVQGMTVGLGGQTTVASNTALGVEALNSASLTGISNTGVGQFALQSNTTGSSNSAVGQGALFSNTTGSNNIGVGVSALLNNTTGSFNTANGMQALQANTTGAFNAAVGRLALFSNTTGDANSAVGSSALFSNTTGGNNTALGLEAGFGITTGFNNTTVGLQAGSGITTGSNNIAIGNSAQVDSPTASNQINVGGVYFQDRLLYTERADPAATAANQAVVYARDNGSGKTQLCVRFNTGAVQVLATEP